MACREESQFVDVCEHDVEPTYVRMQDSAGEEQTYRVSERESDVLYDPSEVDELPKVPEDRSVKFIDDQKLLKDLKTAIDLGYALQKEVHKKHKLDRVQRIHKFVNKYSMLHDNFPDIFFLAIDEQLDSDFVRGLLGVFSNTFDSNNNCDREKLQRGVTKYLDQISQDVYDLITNADSCTPNNNITPGSSVLKAQPKVERSPIVETKVMPQAPDYDDEPEIDVMALLKKQSNTINKAFM